LRGLTVSEKSNTNILTKFIFPKNDCIDLLLFGNGICMLNFMHYGSMEIPSLETMCPNIFPSEIMKMILLGLRDILYMDDFRG
jgi:hypothetical protein